VPCASVFSVQFDRFEVIDIRWIEEHESDSRHTSVNLVWMPREDDALRDDSLRVWVQEGPRGDEERCY
jgi:hypothetical protein